MAVAVYWLWSFPDLVLRVQGLVPKRRSHYFKESTCCLPVFWTVYQKSKGRYVSIECFGSQRNDEPVGDATRQRYAHVDCYLNGIPDASRCIVCIRGHQAIIHVFKRLSCKERALPQIQPERQETWNLRDNRADAHTNLCAACSGVFAEGSLSSGANTSLLNSFYKRLSPD